MSDSETFYESDQDISTSHSKLIEAVSQLDTRQRVKKPERSEPTLEVSEFHLLNPGSSNKDAIKVEELVTSLGKTGFHTQIGKKLTNAQRKAQVLHKPLEKPAANRIKRTVGFDQTRDEVKKWDAIITSNRAAEKLTFPLKQSSIKVKPLTQFHKQFRIQSELEQELAALDPKPEKVETEEVNKCLLTLEEIKERRKEAAFFKARESYKAAKARRQGKIKSKKYHRIQKKEKVKQQLKEFEELQKTDPEAALLKLAELDKTRAEERMSLKHKSTGRWAKNLQVRAKYDKEARQALSQQLSISKELTQKIKHNNDSEEECEDNDEIPSFVNHNKDNPWVNNVKTQNEIDDFISNYRKFWDAKEQTQNCTTPQNNSIENSENPKGDSKIIESNTTEDSIPKSDIVEIQSKDHLSNGQTVTTNIHKAKKIQKRNITATSVWCVETVQINGTENKENSSFVSQDIDQMFDSMYDNMKDKARFQIENVKKRYNVISTNKRKNDDEQNEQGYSDPLAFKVKKNRPTLDEPLNENSNKNGTLNDKENIPHLKKMVQDNNQLPSSKSKEIEIDPNKYLHAQPKILKTQLPDTVIGGEDAIDDSEDEEQHKILNEAFADDDVVEEFRKEKEQEIEKSKPEDIDLSLPGWGSWGGKNIKPTNRKKRRFIVKFPQEVKRKDENKGNVVIIEQEDSKIKKHQVNELPYPFTSVKDFEASVRAPIGRNFVPENAFKRLIEPIVETTKGQIIEPMDETVLLESKKIDKSKKGTHKKDKIKKKLIHNRKKNVLKN